MSAPLANIVIRACAGSGKTYQLVQRLLQLLENGTPPGDILAITFTRKAAAEIEDRLLKELQARAGSGEAWAYRCWRRILFSETAADELNVHTFHSWFGVLLSGQRWSREWYGPADITEDDAGLRQEAWRRWLRKMEQQMPSELDAVLQVCSPAALRQLLTGALVHHGNAWHLRPPDSEPPSAESAAAAVQRALHGLLPLLQGGGGKTLEKAALAAAEYIEAADEENLQRLEEAFFTGSGTLRSRLADALEKQGGTEPLLAFERTLNDYLELLEEIEVLSFHRNMCVLAAAYMAQLAAVKRDRNQMSFDDLEYDSYRAARRHGDVNSMLYRINRSFRHILIDEFQDTSPLQWQVIRCWLEAAHGDSDIAPSVFIVGDAKQAIYGFRHGDSRLLQEAQDFLCGYYAGQPQQSNSCRRLAPTLLEAINALFKNWMEDFVTHEVAAHNKNLSGRVEWHPLIFPEQPPRIGAPVRNPLLTALAENDKRLRWAQTIAQRVRNIVDHWCIADEEGRQRRVEAKDIMLLLPQMTHAALLRDALQQQGLPCSLQGGNSSFTDTLACCDMIALLRVLLDTQNSLSLAQVLKSPLFALSDENLLQLAAARDGQTLWRALCAGSAPPVKRAAKTLQRWRKWALSGRLPVHDLLMRLFKDGDVYARYRAAAAEPARRQVEADLSALLDFSLALAGGSKPLLAQFIAELEGAPQTAEGENAVQLMTVHKAKGLEAPIVVLADCSFALKHKGGDKTNVKILVDWPPDSAQPSRFIFCPTDRKRAFRDIKEKEIAANEREYNNLFYVALTRAKQGLVIYSFDHSGNPRLDRLSEVMQARAKAEDGVWVLGDDLTAPEDLKAARRDEPAEKTVLPPPSGEKMNLMAIRHGAVLHQIVGLLLKGYTDAEVQVLTGLGDLKLLGDARQLLQTQALQQLLRQADGHYEVEAEFVQDGQVLRLDLLIFTPEAIWVIDYKTGRRPLVKYVQQIEEYKQVVAALYPERPIKAAFVTPRGFFDCDAVV